MERASGSESVPPGPIDKSKVLNVKPLRTLVPIFPSQSGASSFSSPQAAPFTCVPPTGPFPPGAAPFYPFFTPNESQGPAGNHIPSPVPLNSFRTPPSQYSNGGAGPSKRRGRPRTKAVNDDGYSNSQSQGDQYGSGLGQDTEDNNNGGKRKHRSHRKSKGAISLSSTEVNVDDLVDRTLRAFRLLGLESARQTDGDNDVVYCVLMVYNLLRRRLSQIEEARDPAPGITRRPDLRTANIMMTKGVRTNSKKRIGNVPGVDVGDIFFFRMEMCLVGLHAPSMAGIDYMGVRVTGDEEPIAVSIVSSGGYEDDGEDADVLVYSGQGGVQRRDKQMFDQKLERGNLALEKSLHRGNEVRVIRGLKDVANGTGKIYVYDGLYKIHESWAEKGKGGFNVFKYKFVRIPGQPEAFTLWKSIQQWKDGTSTRAGVILPDLTSGAENLPVCLVNDVDDEKGPAYFTYFPNLKYEKPFNSPKPSPSCNCPGECEPGDSNCPCVQRNEGFLPYTSLGVLLSYKTLIHECGPSCLCPPSCRNRVSQAGFKVRLEVFKTKNRGWGLRSWDPIRSGAFICVYAGEVVDPSKAMELGSEQEDYYMFDATRSYASLEPVPDGSAVVPFPLVINANICGNVARFMNHSCSPNVFWQPILRENNNESYLHIGFYAIGHIPPMQELTFDYGIPQSDNAVPRKKNCLCGSPRCRGYFY